MLINSIYRSTVHAAASRESRLVEETIRAYYGSVVESVFVNNCPGGCQITIVHRAESAGRAFRMAEEITSVAFARPELRVQVLGVQTH